MRLVDDKPTVIEETYMPIDLITGLKIEHVKIQFMTTLKMVLA